VIRLTAVSDSDDGAIELADKTAKAFIGWLLAEQDRPACSSSTPFAFVQATIVFFAIAALGLQARRLGPRPVDLAD
jgi:hypothetical protein